MVPMRWKTPFGQHAATPRRVMASASSILTLALRAALPRSPCATTMRRGPMRNPHPITSCSKPSCSPKTVATQTADESNAGHDSYLSHGAAFQGRQSLLITRAVVHGDGMRHRIKFDDYGALQLAGLIGLSGGTPRQEAPPARLNGRTRQLRVSRKLGGIRNLVITSNPVRLGHGRCALVCVLDPYITPATAGSGAAAGARFILHISS